MWLPDAFTAEMRIILKEEYEDWLESFQEESFHGLRVNTSKIGAEEFERISPFPLERVLWTENGFYLEPGIRASRHPYYAAGLYYLQEPSAMAPAAFLPVEEGDRVLDLCAAPGGKATELAARLKGTGLLVANDVSNSRAKALLKNLELFGCSNILVTSETPERLLLYFEGFFDKILVDAPCSGEGMFRKDPAVIKDWEQRGPSYYSPIQREILIQASRLLRPGGKLLYSTCTFSPMENEGVVAELLKEDVSFHVLPLPAFKGFCPGRPDLMERDREERGLFLSAEQRKELENCVRLYPHRIKGEGHFLALLEKGGRPEAFAFRDNGPGKARDKPVVCPEWEEIQALLEIPIEKKSLRLYDKKLYSLPEALWEKNLRGLRFLRTGLYLGEWGKHRFTPSQALAMTLRKEQCSRIVDLSAEDERVIRYLKGETLEAEDLPEDPGASGWRLVCAEGFPLGWARLVDGRLRNKYYAGWRWQHASG